MLKKGLVLKGTVILVLFYVLAKIISFFIEMSIASNFGANIYTDSYYLVDGIIASVGPMLSIGVWKVFMPEYKIQVVQGNVSKANNITNSLIVIFLFLSVFLSFLFLCFPTGLIKIFAPGFNNEAITYAVNILKVLVYIFILGTITTFPSAILQSHSLFSKSQVKEIITFIPPLCYLLIFGSKYGIIGFAYSILIGYIVAFFSQYILLLPYYRFSIPKQIFTPEVFKLLKLYPVACLNAIINQLNTIVDRMFSSTLIFGSITFLNYGGKIIHLFDGVFSTAISVAMFPHLTEMYVKTDSNDFAIFFRKYLSLFCAIIFPVMSMLLISSKDIVSLLFGYGKFNSNSVLITSHVLFMYAVGLPAMGLSTIFNDVYYLQKKIKLLLLTTIISIISNIILDYIFIKYYGVAGLSLATTIAIYISLFFKFYLINDVVKFDFSFIYNLVYIFVGCILGAVFSYLLLDGISNSLFSIIARSVLFVITYLFIIQFNIFYRKECVEMMNSMKRKVHL